jgi:purine nucleosidase
MQRLIIDTDPGVDDAHAIMMAFAHPEAQVEAITTLAGNVPLERTTANACTILDVLEQDVPVYAGCDRPLVAAPADASWTHGQDGLGDSGYPRSKRRVADEHAVQALIRLAKASPGELILVAIGPLTNVALATRLDPTLPEKVKRLVVMGGAIRGIGNVTSTAEFNVYADPEAASIVFDAWPELTLISWETTLAHGFGPPQLETLMAIDSPHGEFFRRITRRTVESIHPAMGREDLLAPDGLAVAVALEPDIVHQAETHSVEVELAGEHTRGQTVVDWSDRSEREPNVNLVLQVEPKRLWELMEGAVR